MWFGVTFTIQDGENIPRQWDVIRMGCTRPRVKLRSSRSSSVFFFGPAKNCPLFRMIPASERKHRGVSPQVSVGIVSLRWQKSGVKFASYQEPVKRRRYPEPEHCAQIIHFGSQRQDGALPGRKCRLCTSWSGWEEFERRWCRVFQRRSAVPQGFQGVIESFSSAILC